MRFRRRKPKWAVVERAPAGYGWRILAVDPKEPIAQIIARALRDSGHGAYVRRLDLVEQENRLSVLGEKVDEE
jgi:hypothetical protein